MSKIKSCPRCKKIFSYVKYPLCPECQRAVEDAFIKVRDYLDEHPNAPITQVVEATEVDEQLIVQLLKEERITATDSFGAGLKCTACGAPVPSGLFCEACKQKLARTIKKEDVDKKIVEITKSNKMHIGGKNK